MNEMSQTEKLRIDQLLKEGRITLEERDLMILAVNKRQSTFRSFWLNLFNLFQDLRGWSAFGAGIIFLIITAVSNFMINIDLLFKKPPVIAPIVVSFEGSFYRTILDVLVISGISYLFALISGKKFIKFIDFLRAFALAGWTSIIMLIWYFALSEFSPAIKNGDISTMSNLWLFGFWSILLIPILFIAFAVEFHAVKNASGLKGKLLWVNLIASVAIHILVSRGWEHYIK